MTPENENNYLNNEDVSWECIKPIIYKIRGKNIDIKNEEYKKLNQGQKAIFSFYVYYNHAMQDVNSFIIWSQFFINNLYFKEIENGAKYFEDYEFINLLKDISIKIKNINHADIELLYKRFVNVGERHKKIMDNKIKKNTNFYVT